MDVVKAVGLRLLLSVATPYDEQLLREDVANLTMAFGDETHIRYGTVVVRQKKVYISSYLNNQFLGITNYDFELEERDHGEEERLTWERSYFSNRALLFDVG